MPYVTIPKDLAAVKTKVVFNLTKRQIICFGGAALLGLPTFFLTRGLLGSSIAILLMMAIMLPLFFVGLYERDGLPAEKIARNILRTKFLWPAVRVYETENLYAVLDHKHERAAPDIRRNGGDGDLREEKEAKAKPSRSKKRPVKTGGHSRKRW